MSESDPEFGTLQKPGWLPTAIVVNILEPGDKRGTARLEAHDSLAIETIPGAQIASIGLPESWSGEEWTPNGLHPIEVIDGQHRLWAFDQSDDLGQDYSLPVVAFQGLDISWQAYLFWSINIKPKKINASLAFDLYPLLREQDWLLRGEGVMVYRETRAQELTEALWSHPESPWYQRINMLGDTGNKAKQPVTQAAFVRGLTSTFIRAWRPTRTLLGGLFGGSIDDAEGIAWPRAQQAAFLIGAWRYLADGLASSNAEWAESVRETLQWDPSDGAPDPAFASPLTLLSTDQGVRASLGILNDATYVMFGELGLRKWEISKREDDPTELVLDEVLEDLANQPVAGFLEALGVSLATFDWRTAKVSSLTVEERLRKMAYRGSGGYTELRRHLIEHLRDSDYPDVAEAAGRVYERSK
jgi:DGQHR domain-containing protein